MCIDAPESTTNSLSSGLISDGEGRHHFSVGEENVALCFSSNFRILFARFHATSRAQCFFHSASSWDRWWESSWPILWSDGFWSRSLALRSTTVVNLTHRIGFVVVELFHKIDDDLGGSTSWNTQHKFLISFNKATAHFVATSLKPFARLFLNPAVCECALFTEFASLRRLVEQALWWMPLFTRGFAQVPFISSLHGMRLIFSDGLRSLGLFAFAESFASCDLECSGQGAGWVVGLARLFASCRKLQLFPFEHCALAFH